MTKLHMSCLVLIWSLVVGPAYGRHEPVETVTLAGSHFCLRAGETKTLWLDSGWRRVEKLIIQSYGSYSDAMYEVMANGDVKGTIYVPGRDPSYIVTIGEVVRSIQFRHISGGTVTISDVKAVQSADYFPPQYPFENIAPPIGKHFSPPHSHSGLPVYNQATWLSRRAISLVDSLANFASYNEYGQFLLPIKKLAGRAYAVASAKGVLSLDVRNALIALKRQIEYAEPYLNETFERTAVFELAVELVGLGEKLDDLLD